jgi:hypothetical protein
MRVMRRVAICVSLAALAALPLRAGAEGGPGKAAAIAAASAEAVVQVKVVTKYRIVAGGREVRKGENEVEAIGTVIDPSGLTVMSATNIDPSKSYADMMKRSRQGGEDAGTIDIESSFADVRILMPDGGEVPARVVLRDKDLDLAFVRPAEKPAKPFVAVDLSNEAAPALFDELLILGRMGVVGGRVPSASIWRVEALVRKPRNYYLVDQNAVSGRLGAPVFTLDGKVAGILLLRSVDVSDPGSGPLEMIFGGIARLGIYPVILPAVEVATVAKQAAPKP